MYAIPILFDAGKVNSCPRLLYTSTDLPCLPKVLVVLQLHGGISKVETAGSLRATHPERAVFTTTHLCALSLLPLRSPSILNLPCLLYRMQRQPGPKIGTCQRVARFLFRRIFDFRPLSRPLAPTHPPSLPIRIVYDTFIIHLRPIVILAYDENL